MSANAFRLGLNTQGVAFKSSYIAFDTVSRAHFALRASVHENVAELRRVLGSVEKPLPLGGLARVLNDADGRSRNASTIQRWEEGAEPDLGSIRLMASLAGVTFEEFALGGQRTPVRRVAEPLPAGAKHGRGGIPAHEALAAERAARGAGKKRA